MAKNSGGTRSIAPGSAMRAPSGVSQARYNTVTTSLEAKASTKIAQVLDDMHNGRKWQRPPFTVGFIEKEIETYCMAHNIPYSSKYLYFITERIQHAQRDSKKNKPIFSEDINLINFPTTRHNMEIFYDVEKKNCIYTDRVNKFVVEMNYDMKINRTKTKKVNLLLLTNLSMHLSLMITVTSKE